MQKRKFEKNKSNNDEKNENKECQFLNVLYPDVRKLIIEYLFNHDKFALRQTCKVLLRECNCTIKKLILKFSAIDYEKQTTIRMQFLENFQNLNYLEIFPSNYNCKKLKLIDFPTNNNIKELKIKRGRIKKREFIKFQNLESIEHPNITSEIFWFQHLKNLKKIKIDFSNNFRFTINAKKRIVQTIQLFKNLDELDFPTHLKHYSDLENKIIEKIFIKKLFINENVQIKNRGDAFFENVQTLIIDFESNITLSEICKMKNLENILFHSDMMFFLKNQISIDNRNLSLPLSIQKIDFPIIVNPDDLQFFTNLSKNLANLKSLNFSNAIPHDISNFLSYFPNLEELDCGLCEIKDQAPFKNLKKLKKLTVDLSKICSTALEKENTFFKNLENVHLFSLRETTINLSTFENANNLCGIYIGENIYFTNEKDQFKYFKNLKILRLEKNCTFNRNDLDQLKKIGCKLVILDIYCVSDISLSNIVDAFHDSLKILKFLDNYQLTNFILLKPKLRKFDKLEVICFYNRHPINLRCRKFLSDSKKQKLINRFKIENKHKKQKK